MWCHIDTAADPVPVLAETVWGDDNAVQYRMHEEGGSPRDAFVMTSAAPLLTTTTTTTKLEQLRAFRPLSERNYGIRFEVECRKRKAEDDAGVDDRNEAEEEEQGEENKLGGGEMSVSDFDAVKEEESMWRPW